MARWKKSNNTNSARNITTPKQWLEDEFRTPQPSSSNISSLREELTKEYQQDEIYWCPKSRIQWITHGDRNTKVFHGYAKTHKARNLLVSINDDRGVYVVGDCAIADVAIKYFSNLFTSSSTSNGGSFFYSVPISVTLDMNAMLMRDITAEDIRSAVFAIGTDKAAGVDGYTSGFFQQFWPTIKAEVVTMVRDFFVTSVLPQDINTTQICLIPKIDRPTTMGDFRHISLCNVIYKIISKLMVACVQEILPDIISESQTAFVKGRNITDNVMIAHELIHSLTTRKRQSQTYMAIKTDISKAYDHVEWDFLAKTMRTFGFSEEWIQRVMACVSSVSYSVLVNGSPFGNIIPQRGLHQGDPLSPYLFLFVAEMLSHNITKAQQAGNLKGLAISNRRPAMTHLLFSDDSLFFCQAN